MSWEAIVIVAAGCVSIFGIQRFVLLLGKRAGDLAAAQFDAEMWRKAAIDAEVQRVREQYGDVRADDLRNRFRYMPPELVCVMCGEGERRRRGEELEYE